MPTVYSEGVFRQEVSVTNSGREVILIPENVSDICVRAIGDAASSGSVKKSYNSAEALETNVGVAEDQITAGLDAVGTTALFHNFGAEYPVGLIANAAVGRTLTVVVTGRRL